MTDNAAQAREVTRRLLAACAPGGDLDQAPVSARFRCWTPYRDTELGAAGTTVLRQVLAGFCGHGGRDVPFRPHALISDGEAVVVEAVREDAAPILSVTLVLTLAGGLVDEAKVYVDPRALGALR